MFSAGNMFFDKNGSVRNFYWERNGETLYTMSESAFYPHNAATNAGYAVATRHDGYFSFWTGGTTQNMKAISLHDRTGNYDYGLALHYMASGVGVGLTKGLVLDNRGLVGIGTENPIYNLDVVGTGNFSGDVYASGNVGIGTSSPSYPLHVVAGSSYAYFSSNAVSAIKSVRGSSQNAGIDIGNTVGTWTIGKATDGFFGFSHDNQNINGFALFAITTSGNVGIGDTSPSYKLDVNGTAGFSSTINAPNIGTGEDNSVVILDSEGKLRTDEIDSRVWGSGLVDGTGSASGVAVWSDSNTLTHDTNLIWDSTNDRLGIGTNSPTHQFTINNTGKDPDSAMQSSSGSTASIYNEGANLPGLLISMASSNGYTYRGSVYMNRSRGTLDAPEAVASGDWLGSYYGAGYDGSALRRMGGVIFVTDGTVSAGNLPTSIMFQTGSSSRTEKMRIKPDGKVGIGTAYPEYLLDVNGSGNFSGDIYASGNVGIGTSNPGSAKLNIQDSISDGALVLRLQNNAGANSSTDETTVIELGHSNNNVGGYAARIIAGKDSDWSTSANIDGNLQLWVAKNAAGVQAMHINSDGEVGIGTSSPNYKLEVKNGAPFFYANETGADAASLHLGRYTNSYGQFMSIFTQDESTYRTTFKINRFIGRYRFSMADSTLGTEHMAELRPVAGGNTWDIYNLNNEVKTTIGAGTAHSYINGGGSLGIGNSAPTTLLDVSGVITATGGNSNEWNEAYDWIQASGLDGVGSSGNLAFWSDTNTLTYDSQLHWHQDDNRLGINIGSNTPKSALEVNGHISLTPTSSTTGWNNTFYTYNNTNSNNSYGFTLGHQASTARWSHMIFAPDYADIAFKFDGNGVDHEAEGQAAFTTRMLIRGDTGRVGIGKEDPNSTLHVYSATSGTDLFNVEGTNGSLFSIVDSLSGSLMSVNNIVGLPIFEVFDDDTVIAGRYGENDFYLSTSGDIGIGTANPTEKLHIEGNIRVSGSYYDSSNSPGSANQILISTVSGTDWSTLSEIQGVAGAGSANHIAYWDSTSGITYDNGQLYWDSSNDRLGIGTNAPQVSLDVRGTTYTQYLNLTSSTASRILATDVNKTVTALNTATYPDLTELSYLKGVTSSIQTQINSKVDGSGTSNYISKWSDSDTLTNSVIYDNGSNVGIGTDSPDYKLDVLGGIRSSGNLYVANQGNNVSGIINFQNFYSTSYHQTAYIASETLGNYGSKLSIVAKRSSGATGAAKNIITTIMDDPTGYPNQNTHVTFNSDDVSANAVIYIGHGSNSGVIQSGNSRDSLYTERGAIFAATSGSVGIGTASPSEKLDVSGNANITGHLSAATKSFLIDHPTKEGKKLQYGSLESPYHGVRLTGRGAVVSGKCEVELPEYVRDLVHDDETVNVQITNYKHGKTLYVDSIDIPNNRFTIKNDNWFAGKLEFFWTFTSTRKDVPDLIVEK